MPPWPPDNENVEFANDRSLSRGEREILLQWIEAEMIEGDPVDLPSPPALSSRWSLGEPDLVVTAPVTYTLPAEGKDVFRNLVIPAPVSDVRYVRTVDLRPGPSKVVHHAILYVDDTGSAKQADAESPEPGFPGMDIDTARSPDGHFLGWTPGNAPFPGHPERAWRLEPGMDFVLQLHMMPSGRPETIEPLIGLYFAETPPKTTPVIVTLRGRNIDIPAGMSGYRVEDRFEVPIDVSVLSVYPHAHYLGKCLKGLAVLPDGREKELIHIPNWDFNWQDQYFYEQPVLLPAGSTLVMDYIYDNSSDNPRNPNNPPRRVTSGNGSRDEMAELIVQLEAIDPTQRWDLVEARARHGLKTNPADWRGQFDLALAAQEKGDFQRAVHHYESVLAQYPSLTRAHYNLGNAMLDLGEFGEAEAHYRATIELEPTMARAYHNLGYIRYLQQKWKDAAVYYRKAVELDPEFALGYYGLGNTLFELGDPDGSISSYKEAVRLRPDFTDAHVNLGNSLQRIGQYEEAIAHYRRTLAADPRHLFANFNLALALRQSGRYEEAILSLQAALTINPQVFETHVELADIFDSLGRDQDAIQHYRTALGLRPDAAEVRGRLERLTGGAENQYTLPLRLPTLIVAEPGLLPITVASVLDPVTPKTPGSLEFQKRAGLDNSPSAPNALAVAVHGSPTITKEHLFTRITLMSSLLGPMGEESSHAVIPAHSALSMSRADPHRIIRAKNPRQLGGLGSFVARLAQASRRKRGPVALRPRFSPGLPLSRRTISSSLPQEALDGQTDWVTCPTCGRSTGEQSVHSRRPPPPARYSRLRA
jgi:tetratricopeptide (TPR) repeat protein